MDGEEGRRRALQVCIEAPPRAQPNQKLHARAFKILLKLDRIVSGVEDEERRATTLLTLSQSLTQEPHPLCGYLVLVLVRMELPDSTYHSR